MKALTANCVNTHTKLGDEDAERNRANRKDVYENGETFERVSNFFAGMVFFWFDRRGLKERFRLAVLLMQVSL